MKVFIIVEESEDGRGGSYNSVRGVFTNRQWAVANSYDIPVFDIEEWEVDERDFNSN